MSTELDNAKAESFYSVLKRQADETFSKLKSIDEYPSTLLNLTRLFSETTNCSLDDAHKHGSKYLVQKLSTNEEFVKSDAYRAYVTTLEEQTRHVEMMRLCGYPRHDETKDELYAFAVSVFFRGRVNRDVDETTINVIKRDYFNSHYLKEYNHHPDLETVDRRCDETECAFDRMCMNVVANDGKLIDDEIFYTYKPAFRVTPAASLQRYGHAVLDPINRAKVIDAWKRTTRI